MKIPLVDLGAQYRDIGSSLDEAVRGVIESCRFIGGPVVTAFEEGFAAHCGARHCIGVGNGTDALAIALQALGIGAGDDVLTVANTFIATSEAITMTGARPVFVDCHADTFNIDLDKVESRLTARTRAIVPVHLYGRPVDMPALMELASAHDLVVVEDAAQAHGAEVGGKRVGTWGRAATFSFYPGKNLGAFGDAGAIVTDDDELAARMRMMANHGRTDKYLHEFEGVNSRLDALQAAVLGVKLPHLEGWTEARRAVARRYRELLDGHDGVILPSEDPDARHVYHLFVVRVPARDEVLDQLTARGVGCGVHYPVALPSQPAYRHLDHVADDFPVAMALADEVLSLPMYPELTDEQIAFVAESVVEVTSAAATAR